MSNFKEKIRKTLLVAAAGLIVLGLLFLGGRTLLRDGAEFFGSSTITEVRKSFEEYLTGISASGSGKLEIATYETMAWFSETNEKRYVWGAIPGGLTVLEIKVPVTYRYHVELDGEWRIDIDNSICRVTAPPINPSQPPALHTDRMVKRIEQSWIRFDGHQLLDELERSITPELKRRAPNHIPVVREHGRKVVAEFIRTWLLREERWRDRFHVVEVRFADEPEPEPAEQPLRITTDGAKP